MLSLSHLLLLSRLLSLYSLALNLFTFWEGGVTFGSALNPSAEAEIQYEDRDSVAGPRPVTDAVGGKRFLKRLPVVQDAQEKEGIHQDQQVLPLVVQQPGKKRQPESCASGKRQSDKRDRSGRHRKIDKRPRAQYRRGSFFCFASHFIYGFKTYHKFVGRAIYEPDVSNMCPVVHMAHPWCLSTSLPIYILYIYI